MLASISCKNLSTSLFWSCRSFRCFSLLPPPCRLWPCSGGGGGEAVGGSGAVGGGGGAVVGGGGMLIGRTVVEGGGEETAVGGAGGGTGVYGECCDCGVLLLLVCFFLSRLWSWRNFSNTALSSSGINERMSVEFSVVYITTKSTPENPLS